MKLMGWVNVAGVLVLVSGVFCGIWQWEWIVTETACRESGSTTLRNLGFVAGGFIAIWVAIWRSVVASRQAETAQRGLLNERYQKGAEMLDSAVLSVRLGGIYALAGLAEDHPDQYHIPIFQLFCAFVRRPPEEGKRAETEQVTKEKKNIQHELRPDVQAVMTAISGRSEEGLVYEKATKGFLLETLSSKEGVTVRRKGHFWLDLSGANLRGVDLVEAQLSRANFRQADLSNSILLEANLSHTILWGANLSHANLWKANLSGADISQNANLSHAVLTNANLSDASLFLANLSGAGLQGANLAGVSLSRANLTGANLRGADLTRVHLAAANLTGANLSEVTGLRQYQLKPIYSDANNPPNLKNAFDAKTGKPLVWPGKESKPLR